MIFRVATTRTVLAVWASTCPATAMMFGLLGRTTTSSAGTASTASSRSAVDGFIDWPPATTRRTPRDRKMSRTPSPLATATTAHWTDSPGSSTQLPIRSLTQACSATSSNRSVTRIVWGRPTAIPASMAAPMSSVWTWQFHTPSPPTTTIESPSASQAVRKSGTLSSGASRKYMTS